MKHAALAALAALSFTSLAPAAPALADLRPPPLETPQVTLPAEAKAWLVAAEHAMRHKDMGEARTLSHPRGWDRNLVGGSGTTLESHFAQGAKKGWHLVAVERDTIRLQRGKGAIVRAFVVDDASGERRDEVWVLLVVDEDEAGVRRWRALGVGEDKAQVRALSTRWLVKKDALEPEPETDHRDEGLPTE